MGGKYVLIDAINKKVYHLAPSEKAGGFAAMRVRVQGTVDQHGVLSISAIEAR
jgi:hypothetical protein